MRNKIQYKSLAAGLLTALTMATISMPAVDCFAANKSPKKVNTVKLREKFKKKGLQVAPSAEKAIRAKKSKSSDAPMTSAVSGTPPALTSIPSLDVKNVFWREGVIDGIISGTPTEEQCNEFWTGSSDGQSGGFGACHLAESVGHSLELMNESGTSLCYMKNFPSAKNLASGGVEVVSGKLEGGISKIFAPPSGSPKIVKVKVTGFEEEGQSSPDEDVFIKVYKQSDKVIYKVDLWFCQQGEIRGRDSISIADNGNFKSITENNDQQGAFTATVTGRVQLASGRVDFDPSVNRKAFASFSGTEGSFKSAIEISSENIISMKTYDSFGGTTRLSNMLTRFSGTSPENISFLDGAFRQIFGENESFEGAAEWRNSYYSTTEESELLSKVKTEEAIQTDEFYNTAPASEFDLSRLSCDANPDVELKLDMSNPTLRESVSVCEDRPFRNMQFCQNNESVGQAMQNYANACLSGPPNNEN
jgi:hypothetical protein